MNLTLHEVINSIQCALKFLEPGLRWKFSRCRLLLLLFLNAWLAVHCRCDAALRDTVGLMWFWIRNFSEVEYILDFIYPVWVSHIKHWCQGSFTNYQTPPGYTKTQGKCFLTLLRLEFFHFFPKFLLLGTLSLSDRLVLWRADCCQHGHRLSEEEMSGIY